LFILAVEVLSFRLMLMVDGLGLSLLESWAGPLTFKVIGHTLVVDMKTSARLLQLLTGSVLLASTSFTLAGTWSDDFSGSVLGSDWRGDRAYFSILDGALDGVSASPIAPVPLHQVEVSNGPQNSDQ
jgi:hypothetical protein